MKQTKKITILHSNDLHGDFLAEQVDEKLVGGVSMLSGYIEKVRAEEPNTIYAIAGDMFRGSVIDSEYKGLSTISLSFSISFSVGTFSPPSLDTLCPLVCPVSCPSCSSLFAALLRILRFFAAQSVSLPIMF